MFPFYILSHVLPCIATAYTYDDLQHYAETSQIHTGGILQATPHAVRGCDPNIEGCIGLSRETCAVFMEPE